MSRPRKWPPTISNHRGRARVRIDGRDYYLGAYGSAEAAAEYARLIAQPHPTPAPSPDGLTVAEAALAFLRAADAERGADRVRHFRQALGPLIAECATLPAASFRVGQLEEVRARMVARGWCRNVVNRHVRRVRACWRWLERRGLVPEGRYQHLRCLEAIPPSAANVRHTEPRGACSRAELDAVQARALPAVKDMLELQWLTGARSQEVRLMRPRDIDRTGEVWLYRPPRHKNAHRGHARVIALGPESRAVLAPWLAAAPSEDAYLFRGLAGRRDALGRARVGDRPYTEWSYAQAVRRAAVAAGVPGFQAYSCRHAAKRRLTRAYGADGARAVLGHRHVDTTLLYDRGQDVEEAARIAREAC